jgi:hypothetical protein
MSSNGLVRQFNALAPWQSINMLLVIFPLVRLLGLAEDVFVVLLELVQVILGNITVLLDRPLQALFPFPVSVVTDVVEYLIALGVCQVWGDELGVCQLWRDELPRIMKILRHWLHRIRIFIHFLAIILIILHILARTDLARSVFRSYLSAKCTKDHPLKFLMFLSRYPSLLLLQRCAASNVVLSCAPPHAWSKHYKETKIIIAIMITPLYQSLVDGLFDHDWQLSHSSCGCRRFERPFPAEQGFSTRGIKWRKKSFTAAEPFAHLIFS